MEFYNTRIWDGLMGIMGKDSEGLLLAVPKAGTIF